MKQFILKYQIQKSKQKLVLPGCLDFLTGVFTERKTAPKQSD